MKNKKGFTLVEITIAVTLFALVATFSLGAILSIFDANRKSQTSKTIVDNLNLAIEDMSRTIHFGTNYHCGLPGSLSEPRNCDDNNVGDSLLALNFEGNTIVYRLCNTEIKKSESLGGESDCEDMEAITAPEAVIQHLSFRVFNTSGLDSKQPYVLAVIKGYVGSKPTTQTVFLLETLMSQRAIDI